MKTPEELAQDIITYVREGNPYDDVTLEQVTKMIKRYTEEVDGRAYHQGRQIAIMEERNTLPSRRSAGPYDLSHPDHPARKRNG